MCIVSAVNDLKSNKLKMFAISRERDDHRLLTMYPLYKVS